MSIAILGLGRFGTQLARELADQGVDVLGVDRDGDRVNDIVETVLRASQGDVEDVEFLEKLELHSYDSVVVAIGSNVSTSVLVSLTLKHDLRHQHVIAKASTDAHSRALALAGADVLVNPEHESAARLAHTLGQGEITDYMDLGGTEGIARVSAPTSATGPIGEIDIPSRYNVIFLGRVRGDSITFNPDLDEVVQPRDHWIVAGDDKDLRALQ